MLVKLKPLNWFKQNAFVDKEGDFWVTEELRNCYDSVHKRLLDIKDTRICVTRDSASALFSHVDKDDYKNLVWAIDKILTKEEYPEYFI